MTKQDLINQILVNVRNEPDTIKDMVGIVIDPAIDFVLGWSQWDMRTVTKSLATVTANSETTLKFPTDCDKEIALYHSDMEEELDYITPKEYAREKALGSTSGIECRKYTVQSDGQTGLRFYFYPVATSEKTIVLTYSRKLPANILESLNEYFLNAIRTEALLRLAELISKEGQWSNFPVVLKARDKALDDLVSYYQRQKGRSIRMKLHKSLTRANPYLHR